MFETEAYEYEEKKIDLATSMRNPQIETVTRQAFKDGAEFGYNKALKDIMAKVKVYGLISSEACYSDVFDYENNRISEDELWNRFENNVQRELSMVITDMRIEEIE